METTNNANVAVENKGIDFVAINDDRYKRAEKAYKALDLLQYVIETGQIGPDSPITIQAAPHKNGIGTGVWITGLKEAISSFHRKISVVLK
jgi:hypothetical protein